MKPQIFDKCFQSPLLRAAEAAWPEPTWGHWHRYNNEHANKYGSMDRLRIPSSCLFLLDMMAMFAADKIRSTDSFIDFELHAAGMHMIPPGGFLSRHMDAERHPLRNWRRTHSIILFLNDWMAEWGGELRVEDHMDIIPEAGRMVIFETQNQWHEVLPVSREAKYRKTLALFAWSFDDSADGRTSAHFEQLGVGSPFQGHAKSP